MAKAIHKSCCLQAGASEAVALIEKVISEEQTWGTYKIDKTETDGHMQLLCAPLYGHSRFITIRLCLTLTSLSVRTTENRRSALTLPNADRLNLQAY